MVWFLQGRLAAVVAVQMVIMGIVHGRGVWKKGEGGRVGRPFQVCAPFLPMWPGTLNKRQSYLTYKLLYTGFYSDRTGVACSSSN